MTEKMLNCELRRHHARICKTVTSGVASVVLLHGGNPLTKSPLDTGAGKLTVSYACGLTKDMELFN